MQNALIKKLNNKKRKLIYSKLNFIVPATDDLSALENISGILKGKISNDIDRHSIREERILSKYEIID